MKTFIKIILSLCLLIVLVAAHAQDYTPSLPSELQKYSSPIFIFVSFSMPQESLKQWLQQANKIHAPVILRGLVNNSFKDTVNVTNRLIQDNPGGFAIDPTLFDKYHIEKVPAVVFDNSNENFENKNFDVIYGNVTLLFALEKLAQVNIENVRNIVPLIKRLKGDNDVS